MKKLFVCITLSMQISVACLGQKSQDIELTLTYRFENTGATEKIRFITLIPGDVENRQRIHSLTFSAEPDTVYSIGENRYAEFILLPPLPDRIDIRADLTITRSDYKTLSRIRRDEALPDEETERYLKSELFIEYEHPDFLYFAGSLKGTNPTATVKNIYTFMNPDLRQAGRLPATRQNVMVRDKLMESFRQYSHLMVALCRANSVPARNVYGLTSNGDDDPRREWVEVHFAEHGWVSFDPAPGSRADFRNMDNQYIYLCPSGRDEEPMADFYTFRYWYWGGPPEITEQYIIVEK
ncbi:MAG: transglutaminase family protein [Rikenellaceae bacterium]|nr:transglutaminase family protein [Rikenellaceae bacterium]